jgi:ribose transport system permease protein
MSDLNTNLEFHPEPTVSETAPPKAPESGAGASPPAPAAESATRNRGLDILSRYTILLVLVLSIVVFSIIEPDTFFTATNFKSMATEQVVVVILGIAATIPLIAGEFDVSVGYVLGIVQALTIGFMSKAGSPIWLAAIIGVAAGTLVGLGNGLLVVKLKVNALIATLAMGSVLTGLTTWYSGGAVIFQGVPRSFTQIAQSQPLGIPFPVIFGAVVVAVVATYFTFVPTGRRLYAIGGNRHAALLNGIRVDRLQIGAFVASGFLSGLAGVLIASEIGTADPTLGPQFLLPAFASAFLGATAFRPGRFNILGTLVAAYVLTVPVTGLQELGVANWFQNVFYGLALMVAVAASGQVAALRARAARKSRLQLVRLEDEADAGQPPVVPPRPAPDA